MHAVRIAAGSVAWRCISFALVYIRVELASSSAWYSIDLQDVASIYINVQWLYIGLPWFALNEVLAHAFMCVDLG